MSRLKDMLAEEFNVILNESRYDEKNEFYTINLSDDEAQRILNTLKIYEETLLPLIPSYHKMNKSIDEIIEITEAQATSQMIGQLFVCLGKFVINEAKKENV